ncbi:MAG TPA: hypothetical protein VGI38_11120 [Puia sp.]
MKLNLNKGSLILIMTICIAIACKKSVDQPIQNNNTSTTVIVPHVGDTTLATPEKPQIPYPETSAPGCNFAPDYGDSIVYSQPASGNYYVYPQNNQGIAGTYLSWPDGLNINATTGAINLTQSETGQRYSVAFVKTGTSDTCLSQLIVAGAAYMDSVYVLSQSDTTSKPYFNANPYGVAPCQGNQGQGCQFDYNNFAHNQGIEIDQKTGFIDLKKSMSNSLFGLLPLNGATVNTTIYYKLNDNSNFAPQKIQLKLVYYNHKSDVPAATLLTMTDFLVNTLNDLLISKGPSARPPLIVIVRGN